MRKTVLLLVLVLAGGCSSVYLNRAALREERRAEELAERGRGAAAARARDRAVSLHLQADARAHRSDWANR
ncbi:MAG: hypothetical protein ACHQ17_01595 [Polyangia bacterium]